MNGNLISETEPDGTLLKEYVYLDNLPLAMITHGLSGVNTHFYHTNHLGTPTALTNDNGQIAWRGNYSPFGAVNITAAVVENNLRFPGQYFDGETGLHYNWHRYYDPETGRYLTPDPIGLAGGINPFVYSLNNPISFIDPFGLQTSTNRINFTFIFADVTIGKATDDKGNSGLLFSAAFGFSPSVGINYGKTTTNAPTIDDLEGLGTSAGAASTSILLLGAEKNKVSTGLPLQDAYKGDDSGVGVGIGLPIAPQIFTGVTGILMKKKDEVKNDTCN